MSDELKGPNPNPVKTMREFREKLRKETLKKAKEKAAKYKRPNKNEQASSPKNTKREDLPPHL